jgi:hypothetical protein
VLVVVSLPQDLGGVAPSALLERLEQLAKTSQAKLEVKVIGLLDRGAGTPPVFEYLRLPATWDTLLGIPEQFTTASGDPWKPHVVHFIGHGTDENSVSALALVDGQGNKDLWTASRLNRLFPEDWPRMVVLQACQGADKTSEAAFMHLVEQLALSNVQAVVATQARFADEYAGEFADAFYTQLLAGRRLDEAVQQGRIKVGNKSRWQDHNFGAPVLFTYEYEPRGLIEPPGIRSVEVTEENRRTGGLQ